MDREFIFWQNYQNLENKFLELSKYVFITDKISTNQKNTFNQIKVFSLNIANLLVETCSEIESLTFYLFNKTGLNSYITGDIHDFDNQCLKEMDKRFKICNKIVYVLNPTFDLINDNFKPLENIYNTYSPNEWNEAYNDLKHDKHNKLASGSIDNLLHALGALFLLNIYLRNPKIVFNKKEFHNIDRTFGSKIFSLTLPKISTRKILFGNTSINLTSSESPFKIKLSEDSKYEMDQFYEIIDESIPKYLENNDFELFTKFLNLKETDDKNIEYPKNLRKLIKACIFALRLKISHQDNLSYEKDILINSKERNCRISKLEKITNIDIEKASRDEFEKLIDLFGANYAFNIWYNLRFREKMRRRNEFFYIDEFELSISWSNDEDFILIH